LGGGKTKERKGGEKWGGGDASRRKRKGKEGLVKLKKGKKDETVKK